jgi:hypothetical protein
MAVVLTSATRLNAAPCQHFTARVDIADLSRTIFVNVNVADLMDPMTDEEIAATLRLWARYQIAKGKTLAQLVGGTIFSVIP